MPSKGLQRRAPSRAPPIATNGPLRPLACTFLRQLTASCCILMKPHSVLVTGFQCHLPSADNYENHACTQHRFNLPARTEILGQRPEDGEVGPAPSLPQPSPGSPFAPLTGELRPPPRRLLKAVSRGWGCWGDANTFCINGSPEALGCRYRNLGCPLHDPFVS